MDRSSQGEDLLWFRIKVAELTFGFVDGSTDDPKLRWNSTEHNVVLKVVAIGWWKMRLQEAVVWIEAGLDFTVIHVLKRRSSIIRLLSTSNKSVCPTLLPKK